jgi:hypothetical protein
VPITRLTVMSFHKHGIIEDINKDAV